MARIGGSGMTLWVSKTSLLIFVVLARRLALTAKLWQANDQCRPPKNARIATPARMLERGFVGKE